MSATCRSCGAPLHRTVVDLGETPLANSYLDPGTPPEDERRYPLHVRVCDRCFLVQIEEMASPDEIFSDYAYFSSFSDSWVDHARRFSLAAIDRFGLDRSSLVVELASNDGYLLQHFRDADVPVLGIEPAANVAEVAVRAGIPTDVLFFGEEAGRKLRERGVQADLLVGNNVFAHVPDLNDFIAGMPLVLAPEGVVSLEFPHVLNLLQGVQFDTIYHEHFSYFSLLSAESALARHGLRVFDVEELPTHGGSLRLLACLDGASRPVTDRPAQLRRKEHDAGLDDLATYERFSDKVDAACSALRQVLAEERAQGHVVAGYGAAAKGNTLLNVCGVGPDDLVVVADRSPHKQGRLLPGTRIPVVTPEALDALAPDVVLVLVWNLLDEVLEQLRPLAERGCRFLVPLPTARWVG